ncbi:MAG: hypothetical protein LUF02_04085 [Erysipelotrichaceae bacterium]|nr:hypothetical protein [Erysipelotrichaceae bacterium]
MMKLFKKQLNKKGSVLQITLIAFIIFTFSLTVSLTTIKQNATLYHYIDILMEQKNLEIMITRYYLDEMENSILLSDAYANDHYSISSSVDNIGDYYDIITYIKTENYNYGFQLSITLESLEITKFEYLEDD